MIKLVRIDHRLMHGQVVFSWTKSLGIERIVVIDTNTANDEFKRMSLKLSKPEDVKLSLFTVDQAIERIPKIKALKDNTMLIFGNVGETYTFFKAFGPIDEINYGGILDRPGAKRFSNAIYLTDKEVEQSRELADMGITLYMQQVPTSKKEILNNKLS
ncbi:PTS sugar transporter subunit IIB [Lacticaseibacillus thailandensis]|uniref:PTS system sorbose subfamily IIB component n=1 Tax=Lacticaseibacillus thailandensis DSM 22698 = JCM 13996 TaxID=1423810 RepID=A0A0R2C878_9LACO|nr:PTS sugar transporter subunit IIB [Lacticaseibacillus thailandensis]KRM87536.1 PTS system sorbose subfamily IIB component [Lacticaseibacillus thailandensis DSM 22698 = JCM 13996]